MTAARAALALLAAAILASPSVAQTAAPGGAQAPKTQNPALARQQQELVTSMTHWALLCRPDSADEQMQRLAQRLGELRQRADQPLDADKEQALQKDFNGWKDELSKLLYASAPGSVSPELFRRDLEKGVGGLATIAEDSHVTESDMKAVHAQLNLLRRAVGPVAANYYFDRARNQGAVGVLAAARSEGNYGATERFFAGYHFHGYVGAPRVLNPSQAAAPQLPPVSATESSEMDSNLIDYVTKHWGFSKAFAWIVVKTSKSFGVNPMIPLSMMRQESGGTQGAVSNKGASGLMQLMPDTARALGVPLAKLFDAHWNVWGGVKYIKQLSAQMAAAGYHGIQYVLAAYNAGPGAVLKYGRVPPYRETVGYVANITASLAELNSKVGR